MNDFLDGYRTERFPGFVVSMHLAFRMVCAKEKQRSALCTVHCAMASGVQHAYGHESAAHSSPT
jgi:hypothetical protein